ncbi:MAG: universal stress protein [Gemmatimonadota bacterium]
MFQRVLVPLDGSRFAEVAVPAAVDLAKRAGGTVRFLLVHQIRFNTVPPPEGAIITAEADAAIRDTERWYLAETVRPIEQAATVSVSADVVNGQAGATLVQAIGSWKADLVVMATHGRGPFSRFWLGSVADYLIRHVTTPLLLLRPREETETPALQVKTIMVPLDFSAASKAILEPVTLLAKLYGAQIELVHVVEPLLGETPAGFPYPLSPIAAIDERTRGLAADALGVIAASVREKGPNVTTRVLFGSSAAGTLLERMNEVPPDMVALATHGRGGFRRAVLGSVADKLIRGSHTTVLVMRPPI